MISHHLLDEVVYVYFTAGMFANFLLFVIQAWKLYKVKDANGFSLITFVGFNAIQLSTVLYAIVKHDWLMLSGYLLSLAACGTISIMIVLYRRRNNTAVQ